MDASVEGIIMRHGQPFSMRYPLVEVEGSYGTLLSAGSWAAPRYTSSRLSVLSEYLFKDIKKDTITEWRDNYDNTEQYPAVLPSKGFYNICNGTMGIAVGASSSIPQYNLREVNTALIKLLDDPTIDFDEIYCTPDFATGGILLNPDAVKESHKNGTGAACRIRSKITWDAASRCLIVTELPYMVYTDTICHELENIIENNPTCDIDSFKDLTGEKPLIKIFLTKKASPDKVLAMLYRETSLETYYSVNFTMLDQGRFPKVFTWKEALLAYLEHQKVVYRNGFNYDLSKVNDRLHIIDGFKIILNNVNKAIKVIQASADVPAASLALQSTFKIDDAQAKAILDIKLARLANMEVQKLLDEEADLLLQKARLEAILSDIVLFNNEIKKDLTDVMDKFGDERRTEVRDLQVDANDTPIEEKQIAISVTNDDAVYASETSTLFAQTRNAVGSKFKLGKGEYILETLVCSTNDTVLLFSNKGNYYPLDACVLKLDSKEYLQNFIKLGTGETIVAAVNFSNADESKNLTFVTKSGMIKITSLAEYNLRRLGGTQAIKLSGKDEIVNVLIQEPNPIMLLTKNGNMVYFNTSSILPMGRVALGVRGAKLSANDEVVDAHFIDAATTHITIVSQSGLIKNCAVNEFRLTERDSRGVKVGGAPLASFCPMGAEATIISTHAQLKIKNDSIPQLSRTSKGNQSIKLGSGHKVIRVLSE